MYIFILSKTLFIYILYYVLQLWCIDSYDTSKFKLSGGLYINVEEPACNWLSIFTRLTMHCICQTIHGSACPFRFKGPHHNAGPNHDHSLS
jgi:hypothetical protein